MDKLNEERADLVKKVEKEKSHLASIHREIKKRKDYIRSLHLLEENRYDNIQAQKQYNGLLHILKKYQVDMEQVPEEFRRQTQSIRDASRGLEFGQKGEEKAAEAIKLLGNKVLSLQNLRLKYQKLDIEHDLVIIAPTGIFSVEVKNKRHNGTITEKGILKSGSHSENLIEQIRRHTNSLNQHLEELYKKQPQMKKKLTVYPIILWANNHSNVKDCFHEVPVCYINRLEYEIFKKDKYKANLSRKEMEEICARLKKRRQQNRVYPLCVDRQYLETLTQCSLLDLTKEVEDTTRRLRINEYDVRMLDQRIQKKKMDCSHGLGVYEKERIDMRPFSLPIIPLHSGQLSAPGSSHLWYFYYFHSALQIPRSDHNSARSYDSPCFPSEDFAFRLISPADNP